MQIRKEDIKLSLFTYDMIIYEENQKGSTTRKKLLELISDHSKESLSYIPAINKKN